MPSRVRGKPNLTDAGKGAPGRIRASRIASSRMLVLAVTFYHIAAFGDLVSCALVSHSETRRDMIAAAMTALYAVLLSLSLTPSGG